MKLQKGKKKTRCKTSDFEVLFNGGIQREN